MKNQQNKLSRTPRKHLTGQGPSCRSPRNIQNDLEGPAEIRGSHVGSRWQTNSRPGFAKYGYRAEDAHELSGFSTFSGFSKEQPTDRAMKESKRLFTKCIAEMNSGRRPVGAGASGNTSVVEGSKQANSESKAIPEHATSFRALKIQMIQSVLPEKRGGREGRGEGEGYRGVREFEEVGKKEQVIELFNQSFSNAGVSRLVDQTFREKAGVQPVEAVEVRGCGGLEARAKILQSLYMNQGSDFGDFDLIMQKIQIDPGLIKRQQMQQSVKVSIESIGDGLTMDPFL